jgi:hypothetical protein
VVRRYTAKRVSVTAMAPQEAQSWSPVRRPSCNIFMPFEELTAAGLAGYDPYWLKVLGPFGGK